MNNRFTVTAGPDGRMQTIPAPAHNGAELVREARAELRAFHRGETPAPAVAVTPYREIFTQGEIDALHEHYYDRLVSRRGGYEGCAGRPEPAKPKALVLQVGKRYRNGFGYEFVVESDDGSDWMPLRCSDRVWRQRDGKAQFSHSYHAIEQLP